METSEKENPIQNTMDYSLQSSLLHHDMTRRSHLFSGETLRMPRKASIAFLWLEKELLCCKIEARDSSELL